MSTPIKVLTDTDPMPWGKYSGERMASVPAQWFHWLWSQGSNSKKTDSPVINYIRANLAALKMDYPDGIW